MSSPWNSHHSSITAKILMGLSPPFCLATIYFPVSFPFLFFSLSPPFCWEETPLWGSVTMQIRLKDWVITWTTGCSYQRRKAVCNGVSVHLCLSISDIRKDSKLGTRGRTLFQENGQTLSTHMSVSLKLCRESKAWAITPRYPHSSNFSSY